MRTTLLAATFVTASTGVFAQGISPTRPPASYQSYAQPPMSEPSPSQQQYQLPPPSSQRYGSAPTPTGGGENCGTPHDFKACPPLPRNPLAYYPENRPACGSCRVP